jgi:cytochrome P450
MSTKSYPKSPEELEGRVRQELAFDPAELADAVASDVVDPHPIFAEALRQAPVHRGPLPFFEDAGTALDLAPTGVFTVYGYPEASQVLRDDATFSSSVYGEIMGIVMGRTILEMDGQEHRLHRALVSPAFRTRTLARWENELVGAVVDDLVDRFADRGRADLVRELTFAFPVQVIARILGLPREDYPLFQRWSIEMLRVVTDFEKGMAASAALRDYFAAFLADRRRHLEDDLITDLVNIEVDGRHLSDEEIYGFLRLLLPAGVETTYRALGNLLAALLTHPEQLEALRAEPSLLPQAIEEGLRFEPPISMVMRVAVARSTVGNVEIPEGSHVGVCVAAANRDPRQWDEPDRFEVRRPPQGHVTFGHGVHLCLGMALARMEMRVAMKKLLARLPGLRLDPDHAPPTVRGLAFRSPDALSVVFQPSRPDRSA